MIEVQTLYTKLTRQEQRKLGSLIIGYGALKTCSDLSGISKPTLKRAKDGSQITKENAEIIREKLLNEQSA